MLFILEQICTELSIKTNSRYRKQAILKAREIDNQTSQNPLSKYVEVSLYKRLESVNNNSEA